MIGSHMIRIGRLAGIPFGVHPLWLVIVVLLTTSLGGAYYPDAVAGIDETAAYLLGLASTLTLFAGIVAHELGHAVVARRHGVEIEEIDLWLLGGVARMANEPPDARGEFRFALAGPAVTAALLATFGAIRLGVGDSLADWLLAFIDYQLYVNGAILFFNLLPAFPLDGGRVLRSLLWMRSGDHDRATIQAGTVGRGFGWWFVIVGIATTFAGGGGLMLVLVGVFVIVAARSESERAMLHAGLADLTARDVMVHAPVTIPAGVTVDVAVRDIVLPHPFAAFPVVGEDGQVNGLVTLASLRQLRPEERAHVLAGDLVVDGPGIVVREGEPLGELVLHPRFAEIGRAVVVDDAGEAAGLVSITDVRRRLMLTAG